MDITVQTTEMTKNVIELTDKTIRNLLCNAGHNVPDDALVLVCIPRTVKKGLVEIDQTRPLRVEWYLENSESDPKAETLKVEEKA